MATTEAGLLEKFIEREGPLNVLVVSDRDDYRTVAEQVFSSDATNFQARAVSVGQAKDLTGKSGDSILARVGFKRREEDPDVVIVSIIEDEVRHRVGEQLELMAMLGQKFPSAALIGTVNQRLHRTLFGEKSRDDAHASRLAEIERNRPGAITEAFRITYPDGIGTAAQQTFREEFAGLLRDALRPTVQRAIYSSRANKYMCQLFGVSLENNVLSGAIRRLNDREIPVAFVASRAPVAIRQIAEDLEVKNWYSLAHEGALVTGMDGKTRYERRIGADAAIAFLERIDDVRARYPSVLLVNYFGDDMMATVKDEGVNDLLTSYLNRNGGRHIKNNWNISPQIIKGMVRDEPPHRIELVVRGGVYDSEGLPKELDSLGQIAGLAVASPEANHYQFTHPDASRAKAFEALMGDLKTDPRRVAYVGSTPSDVEVLGMVGHPFILKSAQPVYRGLPKPLQRMVEVLDANKGDVISAAIGHLESRRAYRAA